MPQWNKPTGVVEWQIVPTKATPEQEQAYRNLIGLYAMALCADGIKSFVISQLRITGLWGLGGYRHWAEFCLNVLRMSKSNADRMCSDGYIATQFAKISQPQYEKLLKMPETAQFCAVLMSETADQSPPESHQAVIQDRSVQRALRSTPHDKRIEVVEQAAKLGGVTNKTVKAVIDKMAADDPIAPPKPKKEVGDRKRRAMQNRVLHNLRMVGKGLKDLGVLDPFESRLTKLATDIEQTFLVKGKL